MERSSNKQIETNHQEFCLSEPQLFKTPPSKESPFQFDEKHCYSSSVDTVRHAHASLANPQRRFQAVDHAEDLDQQKVIEKVLQARFPERYLERQCNIFFHLVELVRRVFRCKLRSQVLQFKHELGLQLLF